MKKIVALLMLLVAITVARAQTSVNIPFGLAPVNMDGKINATEWEDADSFFIQMPNMDSITVFYKHDMQNVYFAFAGKLESNSFSQMFPEVLIDPKNKKGNSWVPGQWWFHVSANDCENEGAYGVYTNCSKTQSGWVGLPNFEPGPPNTDSVEIQIPYTKLNFNPVTEDFYGLAVCITNTQSEYRMWPPTADRNKPVTWARAFINRFPVDVATITNNTAIKCYPNPATNLLIVEGAPIGAVVMLIDVYGKVVHKGNIADKLYQIETTHLPSGVYYLNTNKNADIVTQKVILKK